jgi:hypothetical protein
MSTSFEQSLSGSWIAQLNSEDKKIEIPATTMRGALTAVSNLDKGRIDPASPKPVFVADLSLVITQSIPTYS